MWFGSIAAVLTFVPLYFAEDIEEWRLEQQGVYSIRCGPDSFSEMRAGVWTFVAFTVVFTPTLLFSAGRIRDDIFQRKDGHAA